MGGKQKKKPKSGKKEPSIFDKPMENPFLDFVIKEKVPVKTKKGKDLFDKPMENPFTQQEEKSPAEEKPQAALVPRKVAATAIRMPKRKSREEVSATRGWTHAVKQPPKKKTS